MTSDLQALLASYALAVYRVDAGGGPLYLRVGEPNSALDGALVALGASRYAFLSAANPGSVVLSDADNGRRHGELLERLRAVGLAAVSGESCAADGGWREASLLVPGLDREAARALAREFSQVALLWGAVGGPVELLPTEPVELSPAGPQAG